MSEVALEVFADLIHVEPSQETNENGDVLDDSSKLVRICLTMEPSTMDDMTRALAEEDYEGSTVVYFEFTPQEALDYAAEMIALAHSVSGGGKDAQDKFLSSLREKLTAK